MIRGGYSVTTKEEEVGWQSRQQQQRNHPQSDSPIPYLTKVGKRNSADDGYVSDDNTSVTSVASCESDSSTIRAMKSTIRKFESLCQSLDMNHQNSETQQPLLDFGWTSNSDDEVDDELEPDEVDMNMVEFGDDEEYDEDDIFVLRDDTSKLLEEALASPSVPIDLTRTSSSSSGSSYNDFKKLLANDPEAKNFGNKYYSDEEELKKQWIRKRGLSTGSTSSSIISDISAADEDEYEYEESNGRKPSSRRSRTASKRSNGRFGESSSKSTTNSKSSRSNAASTTPAISQGHPTIAGACFFTVPASMLRGPHARCWDFLEHQYNTWTPKWWNTNNTKDDSNTSPDPYNSANAEEEIDDETRYQFERKRWWVHPREEDIHYMFVQM